MGEPRCVPASKRARQWSVRYRFLDHDGLPTAVRWRLFPSARDAFDFLIHLDDANTRQAVAITVASREVTAWTPTTRIALEQAAAEEAGRP